jgi:hypothetical protein
MMSKTPLEKKLRLPDEGVALVLNPPGPYNAFFDSFPEGVQVGEKSEGQPEFVHLFIANKAELDRFIDLAVCSLIEDGLFWISYPKGSSNVKTDINGDSLWEPLLEKGIRPVSQVSMEETWSAIRFRPQDQVGS